MSTQRTAITKDGKWQDDYTIKGMETQPIQPTPASHQSPHAQAQQQSDSPDGIPQQE